MRPTQLLKNTTLYWVINTYDPADGATLMDASTISCSVRKNGSSVEDAVTIIKRSATTGIYDCSYNPSGEIEGDQFTIEELAEVDSIESVLSWSFTIFDAPSKAGDAMTLTSGERTTLTGIIWSALTSGLTTIGSIGAYILGLESATGSGSDLCTLIISAGLTPIADADVWITTDSAGTNVIAGTKQTNSLGQVSFLLDEGITYFLWMQKDGYNPILGESFVAVAD